MYILDEEAHAKEMLQKGFLSKYHNAEMVILVKYYKSIGTKPKQRKELLYEFCEQNIPEFNKVLFFRSINIALRKGGTKKNKLIVIKSILITDKEIEYINNLELDYMYKKLAFGLLVKNKITKEISKIYTDEALTNIPKFNYFGKGRHDYQQLREMSKIPNNCNVNIMIQHLAIKEIVTTKNRGKIDLSFINKIEYSENIAITVFDFNNVGSYFDLYNKDKTVAQCAGNDCIKIIKLTAHNKKYCEVCWREAKSKQDRIADKKYRERKRKNEKANNTEKL